MERYQLPQTEIERYARHGVASVPFDVKEGLEIAIDLKGLRETLGRNYVPPQQIWFTHREIKIGTRKNHSGRNSAPLDEERSLDQLLVAANRYLSRSYSAILDVLDPPPSCTFEHLRRDGAVIFQSDWLGWNVGVAVLPVYEGSTN